MTDESGEVVEKLRYKPFGEIKEGGSFNNSFAFTGREYDQDSGLYYYRSRYYNAVTGRFLQRDPIGLLGGNNLYLYVGNNPVNWVDPWGMKKKGKAGNWREDFKDWLIENFGIPEAHADEIALLV